MSEDKLIVREAYRVIIAGGRGFNDYELLRERCDFFLKTKQNIQIVSGTARGADKLGEQYAKERGYQLALFPADWDTHGKSGGAIRNADMAKYADALIAFWDGSSRGTKHMIETMRFMNKPVKVVRY